MRFRSDISLLLCLFASLFLTACRQENRNDQIGLYPENCSIVLGQYCVTSDFEEFDVSIFRMHDSIHESFRLVKAINQAKRVSAIVYLGNDPYEFDLKKSGEHSCIFRGREFSPCELSEQTELFSKKEVIELNGNVIESHSYIAVRIIESAGFENDASRNFILPCYLHDSKGLICSKVLPECRRKAESIGCR
jgi:hypothetical protein